MKGHSIEMRKEQKKSILQPTPTRKTLVFLLLGFAIVFELYSISQINSTISNYNNNKEVSFKIPNHSLQSQEIIQHDEQQGQNQTSEDNATSSSSTTLPNDNDIATDIEISSTPKQPLSSQSSQKLIQPGQHSNISLLN
jgi:hypothetical protein